MTNNVSTLGQLLENNARLNDVRSQLNTLQIQLSSGKKTPVFSGLGDDIIGSKRTRVEINQIEIFQTNIDVGRTRLRQTVQTLQEFSVQAKNLANTMGGALQKGQVDVPALRRAAQDTATYMRELLNSKDGDRYLLAGADSFTPPIDKGDLQNTYFQSQIESWRTGSITNAAMITNYAATLETTIGYSAPLASNLVRNVYVRADVGTDVDYTLTADSAGFKDILNAVSLMSNINFDKVSLEEGDNPTLVKTAPGTTKDEQRDNFFEVFEDMIKRINGGINKLRTEEQRLERADVVLGTIAQDHISDKNTLETTLGQIEDADPAEVAVKLNALQTQLTAAYQVTALLGTLSLSRYIS
jgi:flagellin-like hook-associated protein FlgL